MSGKRIELDGENVERDGQQFVSGRGLFRDAYTKIHRIEPHGFASQPVKGAKGLLLSPNGDDDQSYVVGGEHPGHRPKNIPGGGAALYDAAGNIIKVVMGDGIVVDVTGAAYTITKGGNSLRISADGFDFSGGTVRHNGKNIGDTHYHGGVQPGSSNTGDPV
ncbi:phage baseplate assembly protein [Agrobacterium sp. CNPSo 3708]|uniref:phage baseplate assembly protein domain-containing protein n=1 Tax=Agrobacterium sp. CNPSo 3708 TaxID=3028150 RepID=UPI0023638113|nr:phage baseplate assembly protein [Agrobacterium sp. CNPSo 3708]MDD1499812.1 phage baseplate assembly protein [Agrobacterium sp. CNPSo 3708]